MIKMETTQQNRLTVLKQDYDTLLDYVKSKKIELQYERIQAGRLLQEMERAVQLGKSDFPGDVIRLNSKVILRDTMARQNYEYKLVLPGEADQRNDKVSVLAPVGNALFGFRKGDTVTLESARGKRYFTIMEVINPAD
jgi:regulator of nucleoside diphosphate kinase